MFPGCPTPTNCPWDAKDVKKENKTLIFKPISNYVYYITKDTGIIKTTEVLDEILCEFP